MIVFHFRLVLKVPAEITVLFRFVMLSFFCAFGPLIVFYVKFYLAGTRMISDSDGFFTIIPFAYYPLLVIFSILQLRKPWFSKRIKNFSILATFLLLTAILVVFPCELRSVQYGSLGIFVLCAASPLVWKFVRSVFDLMFSSSGFMGRGAKAGFHEKLSAALEVSDLYGIAAREFKRRFNCSFVFFQVFDDGGSWSVPYSDAPDESFANLLMEESETEVSRPRIYSLSYDALCLPLHKGAGIFCRIFLGGKANALKS